MENTDTRRLKFRYDPPPAELFVANRKRFAAKMEPGTCAIFWSNKLIASNADAHYNFEQDSNMYYLSGLDQEDCILVIFPDAPKEEMKEMLFVKQTNEKIQVWEGWKYSKDEARLASGIKTVKYLPDFDTLKKSFIFHSDGIYLDYDENDRQGHHAPRAALEFGAYLKESFPAQPMYRSAPILSELRMIKSEHEIAQMRRACAITEKAFRRVLQVVKPGMMEYEVEAEIQHEFLRNGATGPAYTSIVASGKNACVLHYINNCDPCKDGDVLLMDFGAEYGNYSSDLTRSIPVNGKFTARQREVYDAVLRVMRKSTAALQPGTLIDDYHKQVGEWMTEELLNLKLITATDIEQQDKDWPAYKKYFMHGTSHHLGLDTHDVNNKYLPFAPGMVFTVEPGIYIPEENLGIRIENDVLITESGIDDLMASIPIEAEEIESIMQS